ncbi:ZIP family metal transporter [Candidatus Woesearchaeota archaeon]|jgi:zinc and cadmium transporter|nr:ZIP family metal transporter [Candidatus Woesearchaeota archaeon]MBT6519602.1 ZIP family metal transporter [Candidatus Woesearchaeota archaeon]MBT7367517.1 ZIP family metal transporter [Candidatus Woesearchaeota archaeon]
MSTLLWIIGATIFVSLLSLIGVVTLAFNQKVLKKLIIVLVGFSAGGLMGGAFFHLIPESLEHTSSENVFLFVMVGFVLFFIIERVLHWRHCHKGVCDVHIFTYMSLIGDGVHNFIDGAIIAAAFLVNIPFGIITTLVIVFHELPQELGDFAVLIHGGFSRKKALWFNFLSAVTAVLGALLVYLASNFFHFLESFLIPFAAGGFLYVAASDLVPELHKEPNHKKAFASFLFFLVGLIFMFLIKLGL